jgi:hypothetical protein
MIDLRASASLKRLADVGQRLGAVDARLVSPEQIGVRPVQYE